MVRRTRSSPRHEPAACAESELESLLAVLAHDIRSPLHTLGISCELLSSRIDPADAVAVRQLDVMQYTIQQIDRLVGDVLALASLRRTVRVCDQASADVAAVVNEAVEDHRALAEERGVALAVHLPASSCGASIHRASLLRVLANLLTNAIRFTPRGGTVEVKVRPVGSVVAFTVRDSGVGIPGERLVRVFEGGPAAHDGRYGAGGYGLVIVRSIVESCGGHVHAESRVGSGSSFSFVLPRAVVPDSRATARAEVAAAAAADKSPEWRG